MAPMPATSGHSAACCNIPPVVADNYQGKGTYETIDNLKTCKPCSPLVNPFAPRAHPPP